MAHGRFGSCALAPTVRGVRGPIERVQAALLPPTINWFVEKTCNYGCKFCFATFQDIPSKEVVSETAKLLKVPRQLKDAGALKLTFVGGEPFLHPAIVPLIKAAKAAGLTTCVVTNGSLLDERLLRELQGHLDWLTLSIDASNDRSHGHIGRGSRAELRKGSSHHLERCQALWAAAKPLGYNLKLNTVVCRHNVDDDMNDLAIALAPDRWKVFKVLPVEGQNDGVGHTDVASLLITDAEFSEWVRRHNRARANGIQIIPETNDQMTGTYAMLDARGRFFSNMTGKHSYGPSMFDAGLHAAWLAMEDGFDAAGFEERGGAYDWANGSGTEASAWLREKARAQYIM